jgi:hypothetical protein
MFKSQTVSTSRFPHIATAVALLFTIAIGISQSAASTAPVATNTASVTTR